MSSTIKQCAQFIWNRAKLSAQAIVIIAAFVIGAYVIGMLAGVGIAGATLVLSFSGIISL